jgi:uncharacterized repeat protein (TIGR01451 family)
MMSRFTTPIARLLVLALLVAGVMALAVGNSAWASPPQSDKKPDCKRSTVPCKEADLSITKSAKATGSDDFIFTITVKNNGKIPAENVVVRDQLSKWFDLEYAKGPGCKEGQTVTCKIGTLKAGKSVTITIRVDVEPDNFRGNITNTASVSSSTKDPNSKNNKASVTVKALGKKK